MKLYQRHMTWVQRLGTSGALPNRIGKWRETRDVFPAHVSRGGYCPSRCASLTQIITCHCYVGCFTVGFCASILSICPAVLRFHPWILEFCLSVHGHQPLVLRIYPPVPGLSRSVLTLHTSNFPCFLSAFEKVLGTRHTHLKAMGQGPTLFYRILEQGPRFSRVVGANRTRLKGFCSFGMLMDQGPPLSKDFGAMPSL